MIGLGTQDTSEQAVQFVENGGIVSFPMYWDETFVSWQAFGVRSQPAAALLSPEGEILGSWLGPFNEDEVLRLAAEY